MTLNHNFCVICNEIIHCEHRFGLHLMQEHLDVVVNVFKRTPIETLTKLIAIASNRKAPKQKPFVIPIKEEPTDETHHQNDARIFYAEEQILESDVIVEPPEEWAISETFELIDGELVACCNKIYEETNENLVEQATSKMEENKVGESLSETPNNELKDVTEDNVNEEHKDRPEIRIDESKGVIEACSYDNRDNEPNPGTSQDIVGINTIQNQHGCNLEIQAVHSSYGLNCKSCDKIFRTKDSLRSHEIQVHGPYRYQCSECNKQFKIKSKLHTHLETHKPKLPQFACAVCDKIYSSENFLRSHLIRAHSAPNHQCLTCFKTFKTSWSKTRHSRLHHAAPKHICFACGQRFSLTQDLNNHFVTTHVNAHGLFRCPKCLMSFLRRFSLKRHLKNSHGLVAGVNLAPSIPIEF